MAGTHPLNPQKGLPEDIAFQQFLAATFTNDSPGLKHISPIGQIQGLTNILFYQQDSDAFGLKFADRVQDFVHQKGRQS